jgi:3-deoxy-D-manno-octulosonic-acid transferase
VDPKSIQSTLNIFSNAITLTQFLESGIQHHKPIVLIVDKIGLLRTLYQYSYISYIGGGFGKDGVHNVLEPAAFGKPVIWGANDLKYSEAIGLRNYKGGFSIHNEADLIMHISNLLQSSETYNQICQNAHNYIMENGGATQKTMTEIVKYLGVS